MHNMYVNRTAYMLVNLVAYNSVTQKTGKEPILTGDRVIKKRFMKNSNRMTRRQVYTKLRN